jgi:hypothetical protein
MIRMKKLLAALAATVTMTLSATALCDGLMAAPADLPADERAALAAQIAEHKAQDPGVYQAVRNVKGVRPENYGKQRNPVPLAGRELRRLGKKALLPMLEALAFDAPPRGSLEDHEWRALKVGMLDAVGKIRDARARSVLFAAFDHADHPAVDRAAGEAVGRLCDDASFDKLEAALDGEKRTAAIHGFGQCRRIESAQKLVELLDAAQSPGEAALVAQALGRVSSSWAWQAMGQDRAAEGLEVRRVAAEALVRGFVRFQGEARNRHRVAITMTEHPQLRTIVGRHAGAADAATRNELDTIVTIVEQRVAKRH